MKISNIEFTKEEYAILHLRAGNWLVGQGVPLADVQAAIKKLSRANFLRAALGFDLRKNGGARPGGFEPGNKLSPRHPAKKKKTRRMGSSAGSSSR